MTNSITHTATHLETPDSDSDLDATTVHLTMLTATSLLILIGLVAAYGAPPIWHDLLQQLGM